jgi:hypothetical protein
MYSRAQETLAWKASRDLAVFRKHFLITTSHEMAEEGENTSTFSTATDG